MHMALSPVFRPAALRGALDVKIGAARIYTVAIVELLDCKLEITDCCTLKTSHVVQLNSQTVALALDRGSHYITIGSVLRLKMPSLHMAERWFEEVSHAASKFRPSSSPAIASSAAPPRTPIAHVKKASERRIFTFPRLAPEEISQADEAFQCPGAVAP